MPIEESIKKALFLSSSAPGPLLNGLAPEWNLRADASLQEKCILLGIAEQDINIFNLKDELSPAIDTAAFSRSHLQQPGLFVRVRPGYRHIVEEKLAQTDINYSWPLEDCLLLPPATKTENLFTINREVVVQDLSSQMTGQFMQLARLPQYPKTWDCCVASGGKSILVSDLIPTVNLTASDIRESILHNFRKRMKEAGINRYKSFQADLSRAPASALPSDCDFIIADLPCSGSGTWGRNPENLVFFQRPSIENYAALQQKIISKIIPQLKQGGWLLYITCSVFKEENEDIAAFAASRGLQPAKQQILEGYRHLADTMFAALFQKA